MPHAMLKLQPGVQIVETPALNSAGVSQCQLIRYKPDSRGQGALIEKLGGWSKFYPYGTPAVVRALHAWEDTNANKWVAAGMDLVPASTKAPLYVMACTQNAAGLTTASASIDVTPICVSTFRSTAPATTAGSPIVSITDTAIANVIPGSTVYFTTQVAVGGLVLFGAYGVYANTGTNSYQILATNALGSPTPAISSSTTAVFPVASSVSGSSTISVMLASHGLAPGDTFPVLNSTLVGGVTLLGNYIVQTTPTADTFTFSAHAAATATSTGVAAILGGLIYGYCAAPSAAASGYGVGGYGVGGYGVGQSVTLPASTYTGATDWTLGNWGEDLVACPAGGMVGAIAFSPICLWAPTAGTPIATPIPQAPMVNDGFFVAMPQRQIVAWGSSFNGIPDPMLVRWCDLGNYADWIGTVVNQAGSYRLPRGSKIVGGVQAPQQGLLWTDLGVWSMQYISQPYVYSFNEIGSGCGLIGRKAAASLGGAVYWMSAAQFFMLSGSGVTPIECPVWDAAFQNLDKANLDNIRAAPNAMFGEMTWFYPVAGGSGEATHYVKYNATLGVWDYGVLARSAWFEQSVVGPPIAANPLENEIYQHETSPDADAAPMVSSFLSGMFALSEGDNKIFIDEVWPDMQWGYYGAQQSANLTVTFYARDFPGEAPIVHGPFQITASTTFFTPRIRGRLLQIGIESSDSGSWWRIGGLRYRGAPDGKY